MVFKEINPESWLYEKDGDSIEGVLIAIRHEVGKNKATIYTVEIQPGLFKQIWGSTILDQRMSFVSVGKKIRITYKGLAEKTNKAKNPAKIFKVEVDE